MSSLLHFTNCHAQLLPVHFREPSVNLGIATKPPASRRIWSVRHCCVNFGIARGTPQSTRVCLHAPRFRESCARYGKVGGFAHLAALVKRLRVRRTRHSAAARRRRYLAGQQQRCRHSRARIWWRPSNPLGVDLMTGAFGIHLRPPGAGRRARRSQGYRFGRAERALDRVCRLRRSVGVLRPLGPLDQARFYQRYRRLPRRRHRPGLSVRADRTSPASSRRTDVRHPGRRFAEAGRAAPRQGKARCRRAAVPQRHGRGPEDGRPRDAASTWMLGGHTHDGVPRRSRSETGRKRWSPMPARTASSWACSTSIVRNGKVAGYVTGCCRSFRQLLEAGCGDGRR